MLYVIFMIINLFFCSSTVKAGELTVITGPMSCGKTEELIKQIKRMQLLKIPHLVCKHYLDKRLDKYLSSRAFLYEYIEALSIVDGFHLINTIQDKQEPVRFIFFDEVQFCSKEIIPAFDLLKIKGINIMVSGLDMDFKKDPFGECMPILLSKADNIVKLKAMCAICHKWNATLTQRLVNGIPARKNDPLVIVDDGTNCKVSYEPRCNLCHQLLE